MSCHDRHERSRGHIVPNVKKKAYTFVVILEKKDGWIHNLNHNALPHKLNWILPIVLFIGRRRIIILCGVTCTYFLKKLTREMV